MGLERFLEECASCRGKTQAFESGNTRKLRFDKRMNPYLNRYGSPIVSGGIL
jgi:hypothetical protein